MGRGVMWLVAVAASVWTVTLAPACWAAGFAGPWVSLLAGMVCLLPAVGTWLVLCWTQRRSPHWRLAAVLGGSVVRIFLVLAVGASLLLASAALRHHGVLFVATGVVYYLASLATETFLSINQPWQRSDAPGRE